MVWTAPLATKAPAPPRTGACSVQIIVTAVIACDVAVVDVWYGQPLWPLKLRAFVGWLTILGITLKPPTLSSISEMRQLFLTNSTPSCASTHGCLQCIMPRTALLINRVQR